MSTDSSLGHPVTSAHGLTAEIALLDHLGVIESVNPAWDDFCTANGGDPSRAGVGLSYLEICDAARDEGSLAMARAIRAAIDGDLPAPVNVHVACASPTHDRWFDILVSTRTAVDGRSIGAVVTITPSWTGDGSPRVSGQLRSIEDPSALRRVLESMLLIQTDLELPVLLRHVVEEARSMTGARYGALGVLDEHRTGLADFITVGLTPAEEEAIGPRPTGSGVLGVLIADPHPLRLARLDIHPDSSGQPINHPPMTSFLGVPITVRDEVYGNLYLTDKVGWSEFTAADQSLVEALALAAGIAVENHRLHDRAKRAAVLDDRDRLATDLHDTIIQQLFGVGLSIQGVASGSIPPLASERLGVAVATIDDIIRQLRSTIFALGLGEHDAGIRARVASLLGELRHVIGFPVELAFEGPVDSALSERVCEQLLPTIREAVTNVGRHARATRLHVLVTAGEEWCTLRVTDNGRGVPDDVTMRGGLGLANLRRRAERLGGEFTVGAGVDGGTELHWQVPLT